MKRIIFIDRDGQARGLREAASLNAGERVIALTAEALHAASEIGLPVDPVGLYADPNGLKALEKGINVESFRVAREIEAHISKKYSDCRFEGPGFLTSQSYWLQYSVQMVATRAFLVREAVRACAPRAVTFIDQDVAPWFAGDGYRRDPWLEATREIVAAHGCDVDVLPMPRDAAPSQIPPRLHGLRSYARRCLNLPPRAWRYGKRHLRTKIRRMMSAAAGPSAHASELRGLRILVADYLGYDWGPVVQEIRAERDAQCFHITFSALDSRVWTRYYLGRVLLLEPKKVYDLGIGPPAADQNEIETLSGLFDDWLALQGNAPQLEVAGMNLFPALEKHFRAVTCLGPTLVRQNDAVAAGALGLVKPHAVCFFAIPYLHGKRLAHQARVRGIPIVCYQHGSAYGTHELVMHQQVEWGHADYFLTYGAGVRLPANPVFPLRSRLIPVGSARLETWRRQVMKRGRSHREPVRVIWIGEVSFGNTIGSAFQVEDTNRFVCQQRFLEILACSDRVRISYRPYPHQITWDGTYAWATRSRLPIRIDTHTSLDELIADHDLIITDTSNGNVWNEVLAVGRPLILYCDPSQTPLLPHFVADLEKACYWCSNKDQLVEAVSRLANDGAQFLAELQRIDTSEFLRKYVLHKDDGRCAQRVLSFLGSLRKENNCQVGSSDACGNASPL